jgi:hypothetical protein
MLARADITTKTPQAGRKIQSVGYFKAIVASIARIFAPAEIPQILQRGGVFPNSGSWRTKFERRSPCYTTDWR